MITFPTPLGKMRNRALNFHIGFKSKSKQSTETHPSLSTLPNGTREILSLSLVGLLDRCVTRSQARQQYNSSDGSLRRYLLCHLHVWKKHKV